VIWREGKHAGLGRQLDEITRFHPNVHIRQLLTEVALLLGMEQADAAGMRAHRSDIEQARDLMQAMAGAFGFSARAGDTWRHGAATPSPASWHGPWGCKRNPT
jgi:hypothetical protein